jgi:hypothetical protein
MSERRRSLDEIVRALRAEYNIPPPEVPREAMWEAVQERITVGEVGESMDLGPSQDRGSAVVPIGSGRPIGRRGGRRRWVTLATAAATLLILGVGLGRMSAPTAPDAEPGAEAATGAGVERSSPASGPLRTAAVEHLQGTEALLTAVRSDARAGDLDPELRALARGMLSRTRLFLDASRGEDPLLRGLMEDLELVLAQIVAVTDDGIGGERRTRTELELALQGLDDRDVLTRIRSLPGPGFAGT